MWEVDPETKSKLLAIQKTNGNDRCCDCGAPSPQWASPKFSTFVCLTCAGIHRSLGVHISFIRSITMDAFKAPELSRMALGGNAPWREFWERHPEGGAHGQGQARTWEEAGIEERYSGDAGEEWKERLSAKVEGRDYVPASRPAKPTPRKRTEGAEGAGVGRDRATSPPSSLGAGAANPGLKRKARNESFFAAKGSENATRPSHLPPSQGGKYAGFGSGPPTPPTSAGAAGRGPGGGEAQLPGVEDFQHDPVKALTKGFGWFAGAVGKGAKSVNEGWIAPVAQKVAASDLTHTARLTAAQVALSVQTTVQTGTKGAAEQFQRFVEGEGPGAGASAPPSRPRGPEPEKKDFWDAFGAAAPGKGGGGAIGTAAVRKKGNGGAGASAVGAGKEAGKEAGKDDGWGEDGWEKF